MKKDLTIIGAGIVGLATAYQCVRSGRFATVRLLEKDEEIAKHQSTHNSGVLHCGLYYKPGSLKAKMAVDGLRLMTAFCEENQVPFEICGKIVLATDSREEDLLRGLKERGTANGLSGLHWIKQSEIKNYEPYARGVAALHVPQEGIVDYADVADTLARRFVEDGGEIHLGTELKNLDDRKKQIIIKTSAGDFSTDHLITCCGLHSDRAASRCGDQPTSRIVPFRGDYYKLTKDAAGMVKNLIYPVPSPSLPFLGVHFTRKTNGEIEAGPNAVLALKREGYGRLAFSARDVLSMASFPGLYRFLVRYPRATYSELLNSISRRVFLKNLQKLVPDLQMHHLEPGGASGVRAQAIDLDGTLAMDFRIIRGKNRIHVINAPSPAATACLAIADEILAMID